MQNLILFVHLKTFSWYHLQQNRLTMFSWMPAVRAHSLRCCAIRSLGNSRRPTCEAWICDDRAGGNSHNALTDSQFRIFTSARSYDKTYNLASPKSKSYHRIRLIFCRLHSNIIILAPARSSKNSTSLYRAAGGGTQDANYAVPERTSPTSCRCHAKGAAMQRESRKSSRTKQTLFIYHLCSKLRTPS